MQFVISPEVLGLFPGLRIVVALAEGLDNSRERPAVRDSWRFVWKEASGLAVSNAQSHPRVRAWRERFQANGVSGKKFPSSIEALLRRALKGGEPLHINPLVDFYNAVSLRHLVPAGGFDVGELPGDLELRLSRPGDEFQALDEETSTTVSPGEVSYAVENVILTRHFVWKQSRTALIGPATTRAMLVSEILAEVGEPVAKEVEGSFRSGLEEWFQVEARTYVIGSLCTTIEL